MKPAAFDLRRPTEVDQVLDLLAEFGGDCRVLAGGQSLVPMMNFRMATPAVLVDLNSVRGMRGIRLEGGQLRMGAMTRQQDLIDHSLLKTHCPLLARAVPYIGHVQTRSRGTVGGSLAHADPSAELAVTMVALDAVLTLRRKGGQRDVPAREFFRDALSTVLDPDELLVEIAVPCAPSSARSAFREITKRHGDFAIASAAVQFVPGGAAGGSLAAAVGGVTSVPHLCSGLSAALARRGFSTADLESLVAEELAAVETLDDPVVDGAYRRTVAIVVVSDCIREVLP